MRVMDALNVGWRILVWPEVALHPDYPFKDERQTFVTLCVQRSTRVLHTQLPTKHRKAKGVVIEL